MLSATRQRGLLASLRSARPAQRSLSTAAASGSLLQAPRSSGASRALVGSTQALAARARLPSPSSSLSSRAVAVGGARGLATAANDDPRVALRNAFEQAKSEGRPAFVAYTTVGFPTVADTVDVIKGLQAGGADIIELGVPFTDPLADGSTIQKTTQVAIDNGVTSLRQSLDVAKQARAAGVTVPFVLMGYYNPFLHYADGGDKMVKECKDAGISGFIVVDLPPEESNEFRAACKKHKLSYIPLIAPTTTPARMKHLTSVADSFVYCVSLTGVTGARSTISDELPTFIKNVRSTCKVPIAIGFGISTPQQFKDLSKLGDGLVVGSAISNVVETAGPGNCGKAAAQFCQTLSGRKGPAKSSGNKAPYADTPFVKEPVNPAYNFGKFGGRYVPETLVEALDELDREYTKAKADPSFAAAIASYNDYIGRPSRLHLADRLTAYAGGAKIYLKREDLNHTGAHKINNAVAQALLAQRIGKKRIIAETGAGQHGVASATICAKMGLELVVYMGSDDVKRQSMNVFRMEMLGAKVVPVTSGSKTLKDAINEAMRDWVTNIRTTHYLVGSAIGPHPFPTIVRDFQSCIGSEARRQFMALSGGKLPDAVLACVGGGSNAIGMFHPFINDKSVKIIGIEAAGEGTDKHGLHCATLGAGTPGVLHGCRTFLLQEKTGQISGTHSISAGLDYPGVGPEHSHLKDIGRAEYVSVDDRQALLGFKRITQLEGIIPALESSHAIYYALELASKMPKDKSIVVCLSGRGDKDIDTVREALPKFGCKLRMRSREDL